MRQMDPEELLPIGEFSRRSTLTIHQLRHYNEVGLLEPARVDSESRYRYYSHLQVQTAELIAILRSLDLPGHQFGGQSGVAKAGALRPARPNVIHRR